MEKKSFIKKNIAFFVIVMILIVVASIIIRYYVEGEKNMPFNISKIMVISGATGEQKENSETKWDLQLTQNNDIYIDILKNKNYKSGEIIDKVIIDNFQIENKPINGEIKIYRPTSDEQNFKNIEEYEVKDILQYEGGEKSDFTKLQIANQGGLIVIRCSNYNLGDYISNDDDEIKHDGTLINKIGLTNEQIKFKISFDISIELKSDKKYKGTINLEMPKGNILTEGTTNYQINGNEIVFKRY